MNSIESILYAVLVMLIFLVIALAVVYFILRKREKENSNQGESGITNNTSKEVTNTNKTKVVKEYETKSIFDFMEFETVKDNMIVQKSGKKFLMVVECKGINYDLLSEVEMAATEQGFSSFLNTLRDPIQIYIQTRTINLEKNISDYKDKIDKIRDDISLKEYRLKEYMSRSNINEKILKDKQFELMRERNLYNYGVDIVTDTKKMSLNKNVLKKKYYIVISYYYDPSDKSDIGLLTDEEIREVAFSNLYTRAISMIRVLSGIGIIGRTLNSFELVELLYNAYNRDDSEVFSLEKAIEAGYDEIYVDSQNIIDKKIAALNKEIQIKAEEEARRALDQVMDERAQELKNIEENLDDIIADLAKKLVEDENNRIPEEIREQAVEKIEKRKTAKKKGVEESNGKQETKESNRKRRAS